MKQIDFSSLKPDIKRHLSVIGKRAKDGEGKNIFSDITTSTAEDPIFDRYVSEAVQNLAGALNIFVTDYTETSLTIDAERWNDELIDALEKACLSYATLYSVYQYLSMTRPDMSEKYAAEVVGKLDNVITLAYHKEQPNQSESSYADVGGRTRIATSVLLGEVHVDGLEANDTFPLSVTKTPSGATFPVVYSSLNPSVLSVNASTGLVTVLGVSGNARLKAKFAGNEDYAPAVDNIDCNVERYSGTVVVFEETEECDYNTIADGFRDDTCVDFLVFAFDAHEGYYARLSKVYGSQVVAYGFALMIDRENWAYKNHSGLTLDQIADIINQGAVTQHEYQYIYIWALNTVDGGRIKLDYSEDRTMYRVNGTH